MVKEEFVEISDWIPRSVFTVPLIFFDDRLNIHMKTDAKLLHAGLTPFTVSFFLLLGILSNYLHLTAIPIQILNYSDEL